VIDTDANPERVDIAIPANDDAYRSVQVILSKMVDAIRRGREKRDVQRGVAKTGGGAPAPAAATPEPAEVVVAESAENAG